MSKKKTAQSPEDQKTPEINIGLFGHVDHGKTTLTEQLSGKWTDTHSEEVKRGITIRLGYADTTFRKCPKCPEPDCYTVKKECPKCGEATEFLRKVSFVDAPGHESLMATMISGATIIDGALLLISATEECPQPQTREHLMALQILGVERLIVIQNKIDLASEKQAKKNFVQIKKFLQGTAYEEAPIIPISAQHGINIDLLIETIQKIIPTPKRDLTKEPIMQIARSFDINKPGTHIKDMKGGVLGGILTQGKFKVGDEIEIKPITITDSKGNKNHSEIKTKIIGLTSGSQSIDEVSPGGSIGVMVDLDPAIVKSDSFSGAMAGKAGKLPEIKDKVTLELNLLDRVVGTKDELQVDPIKKNEPLMLNVNSSTTVGIVADLSKNKIDCVLKLPIVAFPGAKITISRRVGNRFRLIGFGTLV